MIYFIFGNSIQILSQSCFISFPGGVVFLFEPIFQALPGAYHHYFLSIVITNKTLTGYILVLIHGIRTGFIEECKNFPGFGPFELPRDQNFDLHDNLLCLYWMTKARSSIKALWQRVPIESIGERVGHCVVAVHVSEGALVVSAVFDLFWFIE